MSEAGDTTPGRSEKSPAAFRTISEVAEDLDLPPHVLRFWESKFPQLKPLKRGGGRRYYRPEDVLLLRRIRQCLYQDGYTIRGVQKLLGAGEDIAAGQSAAAPSLFPLDANPEMTAPAPSADLREGAAPPDKPPRRPRRAPTKSGDVEPRLRAALEDLRQELRTARALLAELFPPSKER